MNASMYEYTNIINKELLLASAFPFTKIYDIVYIYLRIHVLKTTILFTCIYDFVYLVSRNLLNINKIMLP